MSSLGHPVTPYLLNHFRFKDRSNRPKPALKSPIVQWKLIFQPLFLQGLCNNLLEANYI